MQRGLKLPTSVQSFNKYRNIPSDLSSKGRNELAYLIGNNYALQLPQFEPNYYFDISRLVHNLTSIRGIYSRVV